MAEYRLPLGAMPNGVTSVRGRARSCERRAALTHAFLAQPRSYATPSKAAASPGARALDFASPFSASARANPRDEAQLLTALNTRLKKRLDDVERTAAKCVHTPRCCARRGAPCAAAAER